jgi:hypothetical protein
MAKVSCEMAPLTEGFLSVGQFVQYVVFMGMRW